MSDHQPADATMLSAAARDHLWMHFTRLSAYRDAPVPVIVRGDGPYIYDANGRRYLDGLAGLFVVQVGHGRQELADAAAKQASELAFFPLWSYAHPKAIELAERLSDLAPGDLNRVFFTTGGSEAVESAWKLARSYFRQVGKPLKTKVLSRSIAYHGTSMGALSITGIPALKQDFEPLMPVDIPGAQHQLLPPARRVDDPGAVRPVGRRPHRRGDRVRRARHGRGRLPRAGAERRWLLPAAARLLPAGTGDLRPLRRAARLRRGDLRVRPAR